MSFARAFSTNLKRERTELDPIYVGRAATQRNGRPVVRTQISSPMALESTSNPHVYTARSIAGTTPIEIRQVSQSSVDSTSSDESDATSNSERSEGTVTDASSINESPISISSDAERFSSSLKPVTAAFSRSRSDTQSSTASDDLDLTPRIPQRGSSRSKLTREAPHHEQSAERSIKSPTTSDVTMQGHRATNSGSSPSKQLYVRSLLPALNFEVPKREVRSSFDIIGPYRPSPTVIPTSPPREKASPVSVIHSPQHSPFDEEIAQIQEVAEGFGRAVRSAEDDAESRYLAKRGLATFSASEYMSEIQGLIHSMFAEEQPFFKALGGFF